jgi:hypothetical protein
VRRLLSSEVIVRFPALIGISSAHVAVVTLAVFGLNSSNAYAQAQVKVVGAGAARCPAYFAETARNTQREGEYFTWAQGFLSGLLTRGPDKEDKVDLLPETLPVIAQIVFLRRYCAEHADKDFSDAVVALYQRLVRRENRK